MSLRTSCVAGLLSPATTIVVAAAVAGTVFAAARPAQAQAQEGQTVTEVVVSGVVNTNRETIVLTAGTKTGQPFSSAAFEKDKVAIRDLGLYASVGGRVETTPDGKLRVVFDVIENPVVQKIEITGVNVNSRTINKEKVREQIRSVEGQVLNTQTVLADIQRIQRLYSQNNYLAYVDEKAGIEEKTGVLTFPIVETTVESIQFTGNNKTKSYVFQREMKTRVGEPYNTNILSRDLTRVFNLQFLDDIGPVRPEPGSDLGRVRLVIPVQERRTGTVGVSFGYSSRQRLVGALELSESNFRGRGQGVNFRWEVGGIASRNSFELGFSDPYLLPQHTGLSVSLFDRVVYRFNRSLSSNLTSGTDDDPYYERRQGGAVTLSRPFPRRRAAF
jgi:outer membrane protein insertion porin family